MTIRSNIRRPTFQRVRPAQLPVHLYSTTHYNSRPTTISIEDIEMPPKGSTKRKPLTVVSDDSPTPPVVSLAEQFSYNHFPRPFKNPEYTKNNNRRTKNLKAVLTQERERERVEREQRRQQREEQMDVDGAEQTHLPDEDMPTYSSIEAPPSVLPQRRYCDITGLEGPYTDPATGLRYHDKSVYDMIRGLSATAAKDYLAARGVNPIVR